MGASAKRVGAAAGVALGLWAAAAAGSPSDDIMAQPLTPAEEQRAGASSQLGQLLAPEDAELTDSWSQRADLPPLQRRSELGGAVGWNFNVPLGSVRDFAADISPVGLEIQLRYWALPQVSFALSGEWDSFGDTRSRSTYVLPGGALTATAYNNLFSAIVRFIPTYYFSKDGPVLPYVAPNLGVAWNEYRSRAADLELSHTSVSIAYGLESGVLIPTPMDGPMFMFQVRYSLLPASEFRDRTSNMQTFAMLAGLAF